MEWINLKTSALRSPEYIGSKPAERAAWINVLGYACEQENGGILRGAANWKDRQWQQTCGVTLKEVRSAKKLLRIEGDDVIVHSYPVSKQEEVKARRVQAGEAARKRWDNKLHVNGSSASHPSMDASRIPPRIAPRNAEREVEREREVEVCVKEGGACAPSTTTPHNKIVDAGTIHELQEHWPRVDVALEAKKAREYVKRERGGLAELELQFFVREWLPKAPESATAGDSTRSGEPEGWREWFLFTYPIENFPERRPFHEGSWSSFPDYLKLAFNRRSITTPTPSLRD